MMGMPGFGEVENFGQNQMEMGGRNNESIHGTEK